VEEQIKTSGEILLNVELSAMESLRSVIRSHSFYNAVELIRSCKGRVVVTGMGKSGIIGKKISATFASTGTPSFFMHPAEALHGDLGMTREEDLFLALSNSGDTEEIVAMLPSLRTFGNPLIAITGKRDSLLAARADVAMVYEISEEGCPTGLAPMATTTATLVLGDALAASLMQVSGFERKDFARFHPRGSLGRKLLTTVGDLMISEVPTISTGGTMNEALKIMIETNLGAVLVTDDSRELLGLISDGDVKRYLGENKEFLSLPVEKVMTENPISIDVGELAEVALRAMETRERLITVLPVLEGDLVVGLIRLHDIIRAKIR
jgi:arabinose-5-phosphate isomerase